MRAFSIRKIFDISRLWKTGRFKCDNGYYSKDALEELREKLGREDFKSFTEQNAISTTPEGAEYVKMMGGQVKNLISRKIISRKIVVYYHHDKPVEVEGVLDWKINGNNIQIKTFSGETTLAKQNMSKVLEHKIISYVER